MVSLGSTAILPNKSSFFWKRTPLFVIAGKHIKSLGINGHGLTEYNDLGYHIKKRKNYKKKKGQPVLTMHVCGVTVGGIVVKIRGTARSGMFAFPFHSEKLMPSKGWPRNKFLGMGTVHESCITTALISGQTWWQRWWRLHCRLWVWTKRGLGHGLPYGLPYGLPVVDFLELVSALL